MFPGMSPRELKRLMKRMGIKYEELGDVTEIVIRAGKKEIVLENPQVIILDTGAQKIYQIVARRERVVEKKPSETSVQEEIEISEEDVEFVAQQAGVSREEARKALIEAKGDIAEAILRLKG